MSNLDTLIALGKLRKVHTFEHGGLTLQYRGLSNAERREWIEFSLNDQYTGKTDGYLIALALCEADGSQTYKTLEERLTAVDAINHFDPVEITKPMIEKIQAASGMSKPAADAAAKN